MKKIKIFVNDEKIKTETGRDFTDHSNDTEANYIYNLLEWLKYYGWYFATHNKNLTKDQYNKAQELQSVLNALQHETE